MGSSPAPEHLVGDDALVTTGAPIIASVSASRALAGHPRDPSDAMRRTHAESERVSTGMRAAERGR